MSLGVCVCIRVPAFTALGYGKVNHNGAWDVAVRLWGTARPVFTAAAPCSIPVSTGVRFQFLRILSDTYFPSADLLVLIITFLVGVNSAPS